MPGNIFKREVYVLITTPGDRLDRESYKLGLPNAFTLSARVKRKKSFPLPQRRSKRLRSEDTETLRSFGESEALSAGEENMVELIPHMKALPQPARAQRLVIRLPPPKSPFAFIAKDEEDKKAHNATQPDVRETLATSSGTSSSTSAIRRVRLIVRPPRSPSPESAENDSDDSDSVRTCTDLDSLNDAARLRMPTRPPKYSAEGFFDPPYQSNFRRSTSPEGIYYVPPQPKEEAQAVELTPASDNVKGSGVMNTLTPIPMSPASQLTPESTRGSTESESDLESDLEFEYPDWTPPPSPPVKNRYRFINLDKDVVFVDG